MFHTDQIRYYLHHIEDKRPDLLQEIVDKGEIYKHLDELDTKVTDTVNRQTDLLMQSSRDYQIAVASGDLNAVGSIGNLLRMQAQRAVYDTMIYLWRGRMMFCANCYKEIPAGKSYYKHQDTNQSYCSLDCLNDHMIYTHTITLETSEGAESTEEQDNDE